MAAVKKGMIELMDSYINGQSWEWGKCDCIGLLFYIVNNRTGLQLNRSYHLPAMDYHESVRWLIANHSDPLTPYKNLMEKAGLKPQEYQIADQIWFAYGGGPVHSMDGEHYPIDVVPGVIFKPRTGGGYALMSGGLKSVMVYRDRVDKIVKYGLPGAE